MSEITVIERFAASLERNAGATAITLVSSGGEAESLSYADLHVLARRAARGLQTLALGHGDILVLSMPAGREILAYYLASLCTGVIPLIVPERHSTTALVEALAATGPARVLNLAAARQRLDAGEAAIVLRSNPDDVAHLQATSGSTGVPKVAIVRHRNVSANVRAIGDAVGQGEGDRIVSWLPLNHDMGLICVSCALFWQRPFVLTDPSNFVRHPIRYWLQLISTYGGTISPAPASAYQICSRLARRRRFEGLDLSRWRVGFCGAEPVHPRTVAEFNETFAPYGLSPTTLLPVYGLAEATLAVTIPDGERPARMDTIERAPLEESHRAEPGPVSSRSVTFVSVGRPLSGHTVTIIDRDGRPLPERSAGEIEVRGPSVIDGYWGAEALPETGLRTGDIGYLAGGELFITGRKKDIIIVHGRNLLPSQLEAVVEEAVDNGIQNGIAAVGVMNEALATEDLHFIVESREAPPSDAELLEERIRAAIGDAFELTGVFIHWVRKGSIPKTPSGKIQRSRCRELLLEGAGALAS